MKRLAIILVSVAVIGLSLLSWLGSTGPDEQELTPATEVAVHAGIITLATLRAYVTAYGSVEAEPAGERPAASARIAPAVPGVVVNAVVTEGQQVRKGELLFELDSRAADVAVSFAEKTLAREKQLIQGGVTSPKKLQEAQQQLDAAVVQRSMLRVVSPLNGTVTRVNVSAGEAVDLATVLAEVADLGRLVISAGIPVTELRSIELGQRVEITTSNQSMPIAGTVSYIGSNVDDTNGTTPIRVSLPNDTNLRSGQFVAIRVVNMECKDCLAAPVESVVRDAQGETVIAVIQNDTAVQKRVTTGLRDGGLIEITADGLETGMKVVTQGAYALPRETRVRVIEN
jgi:RND family efflux transporter MFP subunit